LSGVRSGHQTIKAASSKAIEKDLLIFGNIKAPRHMVNGKKSIKQKNRDERLCKETDERLDSWEFNRFAPYPFRYAFDNKIGTTNR